MATLTGEDFDNYAAPAHALRTQIIRCGTTGDEVPAPMHPAGDVCGSCGKIRGNGPGECDFVILDRPVCVLPS